MDQLYILGTGNAVVTKCYNTCFALYNQDEFFLVDTGGGNGILSQITDMEIEYTKIHHIFITHNHTDHLLGIIWMIRMVATKLRKGDYHGHLSIYCYAELAETIRTICQLTLQDKFYQMIDKRILFVPIKDGETKQILTYSITFFDVHSTKAKQFGFTTLLDNGKKLSFTGDEPYNSKCIHYVKNADWLLHEAFCMYRDREEFQPYEKHHSTVREACELAHSLHIPNLILWHTEDKHISLRKQLYIEEGQTYYKGNLLVPDDKEIITLSSPTEVI